MNNGFLSQEEIDALLGGNSETSEESPSSLNNELEENLSELEKDVSRTLGDLKEVAGDVDDWMGL